MSTRIFTITIKEYESSEEARVSTDDIERAVDDLLQARCDDGSVFVEETR